MSIPLHIATLIMKYSNRSSHFGGQLCNTPSVIKAEDGQISIATRRAFEDGHSFFERFDDTFNVNDLAGKDVLDIGSGCGGRTAYYLLHGNPRSITGLDISQLRSSIAQDSVKRLGTDDRISFAVGFGETLPFKDESFDLILSYDVFEHVDDLPHVLQECYRVLRNGGHLVALFPPYFGPRAHHLDFVTTIPFLHHVFSPKTLVDAANRILVERPALRETPLPAPEKSYLGREVLPRLNGTTERDFRKILADLPFKVEQLTLVPFGWGKSGFPRRAISKFCQTMINLPDEFQKDVFVSTIRCVLSR